MIVYKLRAQDGTYVTNGPRWKRFGPPERARTWKRKGHLKNHLTLAGKSYSSPYAGKVIVVEECEITETPKNYIPLSDFMAELEAKKREREQRRKEYWERIEREERRAEYERLQKEFGNE